MRPQEGQRRSVIQCSKCDAIRSMNPDILLPGKSRLATHWGNQANAQFLAPGQLDKLPHYWPRGQPSQCPISGRLTSCYLAMGDSHFLWIRTYSTSSTLVAALGPTSSLSLEHARLLGQENRNLEDGIVHLRSGVFSFALLLASFSFVGCSGLVAGNNGNPLPPSTLIITNVQTGSVTTSSSQVVWTTNVLANSSVDFGTTTAYGTSTPVDSGMVTSHQMTLSSLAAGTTYYYQVNSTDSKGNHGHSGNHTLQTAGFSMSGTINPTAAGNGAAVALSGAASAATTADSSGKYTFAGL